jgi:hypothetical protein
VQRVCYGLEVQITDVKMIVKIVWLKTNKKLVFLNNIVQIINMKTKLLIILFISLILISGISPVYAVEPQPIEPGKEPEKFGPSILVWFKLNVTKNEAVNLIESFKLSKYKLSEPGWNEESWADNIGGMVAIEVPQGSEQEFIQKFKESDLVKTADLDIIYGPGGQNEQQIFYNNLVIIISIIIVIIFVLFLIWYKFFRK